MTDCVILMNDRLGSLSHSTHSSSLNTQLLPSPQHQKVFFVSSILTTEHLIVLVHDIFDGGLVHMLVDHFRYHVSESVRVRIRF